MRATDRILSFAASRYLYRLGRNTVCPRTQLAQRQDANWRRLRQVLQGTRIHRDLGLAGIRSYSEYVAKVPVHDYAFFEPYVERVERGESNVLFADSCTGFALSSGTSGYDSKKIPLNQRMLRSFVRAQTLLASRVALLERDAVDLFKFERLTFGSAPVLYRKGNFNYGYISGVISTRMPRLLRKRTFPSERVLALPQWEQKLHGLMEETVGRDIRMVSGIPTYMINIFEYILERAGLPQIRALWPNLRYFLYAGTAIDQYLARINELVGQELRYYGFYTSTEAPIGIPYRAYSGGAQQYLLNPDLLVSFTPSGTSDVVGVTDIACTTRYMVNIGTPNGFVHYAMKDVVQFEEIDGHLVFQFVGRDGEVLNLAAEKVTKDDLLRTVDSAKQQVRFEPRHFLVSPCIREDGVPAYRWTLFVNRSIPVDEAAIAAALDDALQRHNLDYRDCRRIGVIGSPVVSIVDAALLDGYFARNRGSGQFKMKTTFKSSDEYAHFMRDQFGISAVCR